MKWRTNLRLSLRAIGRSRGRTALSVSGVAVGIASVVVLLGAGAGAERAVQEALERLGRDLLVVKAAPTATSPLRGASRPGTTLTLSDWHAIRRQVPGALHTAPVVQANVPARVGGRTVQVRVTGTSPEFSRVRGFALAAGRPLDRDDLLDRRRVAVVGPLVVDQLFRGELPLGETLLLRGVPFRIVGVSREKGISADGANEDEVVIIPLSTAMRRLLGVDSLDRVYVQAASEEAIPSTRSALAALLGRRHAMAAGRQDDFTILDQNALVRATQETGGFLSRLVAGLGALALGLGGTGLLAVSLLSVRERTPEIGLRLAVGGRPRDILWQFLSETVLISAMGGAAGWAAGAAGIGIGAALTRWPMRLGWEAVLYPLAISVAIAVIFGTYPALRAARLDPILALNSR